MAITKLSLLDSPSESDQPPPEASEEGEETPSQLNESVIEAINQEPAEPAPQVIQTNRIKPVSQAKTSTETAPQVIQTNRIRPPPQAKASTEQPQIKAPQTNRIRPPPQAKASTETAPQVIQTNNGLNIVKKPSTGRTTNNPENNPPAPQPKKIVPKRTVVPQQQPAAEEPEVDLIEEEEQPAPPPVTQSKIKPVQKQPDIIAIGNEVHPVGVGYDLALIFSKMAETLPSGEGKTVVKKTDKAKASIERAGGNQTSKVKPAPTQTVKVKPAPTQTSKVKPAAKTKDYSSVGYIDEDDFGEANKDQLLTIMDNLIRSLELVRNQLSTKI